MILSFLASCCLARPPGRSRDLGEVPLFERRLSNIMGVHREVGFHTDQQHHHWWKLNERISSMFAR